MITKTVSTEFGKVTYHMHCNNVPRDIVGGWSATQALRKEFDYINWSGVEVGQALSAALVEYRGAWYDLGEFESAPDYVKALGFDLIQTNSVWSATVVRLFDKDGEPYDDQVVMGFIHW